MTLSEYLNRLKDERNLTLAQIADISGVPAGTVQRIMSGSTENPAFQAVVRRSASRAVLRFRSVLRVELRSPQKPSWLS